MKNYLIVGQTNDQANSQLFLIKQDNIHSYKYHEFPQSSAWWAPDVDTKETEALEVG